VTWTCIGAVSSFTTKWAAPHARLAAFLNGTTTWLANAGMNVYVGDDHAETTSANITLIPGFAANILCVDHIAAFPLGFTNLRTPGSVTITSTAAFTFNASAGAPVYCYGIQFISNSSATFAFSFTQSSQMRLKFEQCLISFGPSSTGIRLVIGGGFNSLTEFI